MPLVVSPCRRLCDWAPADRQADTSRRFSCTGCGSEWEPGQGWTPQQADGSQPVGIAEELSRSAAAADSEGS